MLKTALRDNGGMKAPPAIVKISWSVVKDGIRINMGGLTSDVAVGPCWGTGQFVFNLGSYVCVLEPGQMHRGLQTAIKVTKRYRNIEVIYGILLNLECSGGSSVRATQRWTPKSYLIARVRRWPPNRQNGLLRINCSNDLLCVLARTVIEVIG